MPKLTFRSKYLLFSPYLAATLTVLHGAGGATLFQWQHDPVAAHIWELPADPKPLRVSTTLSAALLLRLIRCAFAAAAAAGAPLHCGACR